MTIKKVGKSFFATFRYLTKVAAINPLLNWLSNAIYVFGNKTLKEKNGLM